MKTVGFNGSLIFEIWIKIQCYVGMVLVALKMPDEKIERISNRVKKVFDWVRHRGLVVERSILDFLPDFLHME